VASKADCSSKPQPNSKGLATEKPTVLVVDDEQMIADTTAELLNMFGCRAVRAYSGRTALQIAAELKPDYLLADVMMPFMNGVELAIAITKMLPATEIVLLSGQPGISEILRQAAEEGYVFDLLPNLSIQKN
jgi:CheY-like chemotaxis protein